MARIRSIKPGFFTDSEVAKLSPMARLFFVGLWCHADREGRLEDKPEELAVKIIPYDLARVTASQMLDELTAPPAFITRYQAAGKAYIQVKGFTKHQRPPKSEPASTIPEPTSDILVTDLFGAGATCDDFNRQEGKGKEGKGKEGKGLAAEAAGVGLPAWPDETPKDKLIAFYIKSELPVLYERASQEQINEHVGRFSRAAVGLLSAAGGLDMAMAALAQGKAYYNGRGLDWTLDTVVKNAAEFVNMAMRQGVEHAS